MEERTHIHAGDTTPDGTVSLVTARCLGACGVAPAVVLDGKVRGHETPQTLLANMKGWFSDGSA
jgi:bidirectional [NiFe] hydrogenase diaphorase subunit